MGRGEGFDVIGGGHLDVAYYVEEDAEGEGFQAAEDVGDFGHGGFDDGCGGLYGVRGQGRWTEFTIDDLLDD